MLICLFKQSKFAPFRQFPSFSIKRSGTRKPQDFLLGKNSFCSGLLARDISNHSYAPNKPLTQVLNPLCENFSVINIVHDKLKHVIIINGLRPIYIFVSVRPALGWLVSSIGRALHRYHTRVRIPYFPASRGLSRERPASRENPYKPDFFFQAFFSQM